MFDFGDIDRDFAATLARGRSRDRLKLLGFVLMSPVVVPVAVAFSPFILAGAVIKYRRERSFRESFRERQRGLQIRQRGTTVPPSVQAQWTRDNHARMLDAQRRAAEAAAVSLA